MNIEESKNLALDALGYLYSLISATLRKDMLAVDLLEKNNFSKSTLVHSSLAISTHIYNSLDTKNKEKFIDYFTNDFENNIFYNCVLTSNEDQYILYETIEILSKSKKDSKTIILPILLYLVSLKADMLNKEPIEYSKELCKSIQYIKNSVF